MDIIIDNFGELSLLNYIDLTNDEKLTVLNMRNHSNVKNWMYTQGDISENDHFQFIESLKNDSTKKYFLIKQNSIAIGTINFTKIDNKTKTAEFGFFRNPDLSIKGLGEVLLQLSIEYAFKYLTVNKVKLEVFSDNQRAISLYKYFGFIEVNTKHVNGKDILCMEISQQGHLCKK